MGFLDLAIDTAAGAPASAFLCVASSLAVDDAGDGRSGRGAAARITTLVQLSAQMIAEGAGTGLEIAIEGKEGRQLGLDGRSGFFGGRLEIATELVDEIGAPAGQGGNLLHVAAVEGGDESSVDFLELIQVVVHDAASGGDGDQALAGRHIGRLTRVLFESRFRARGVTVP